MQFAKYKRTGTEVSATEAISGRNYLCPVCGEDVYVRGGLIRVRHFAHRSGRADPDCENYHGGSSIRHPLTPPGRGQAGFGGDHEIRIDRLALGLLVESAAGIARGERRRWRLFLRLPKSLTSVGKIRVPTGFGTISKEIRLLSLSQAAQDINVSPNSPRFGPEWISDEVDHDYRDAVSDRLEGFAHVSAQAFAANAVKIKPLANCFVWGDSYYMIWKLHDLVIPEVLNAIALAPHEGWFAALITLPPTPNEDVERWLQDMFHLRLLGATRQWGIVYPPPIDIDLDGNIAVCDGAGFVLGFRDAAESKNGNSTLSVVTTAGEVETSVEEGAESLIYVSHDAPDALDSLRLQWDETELPSIKAAQIADAVVPFPVVMLRLHDVGADRDVEIPYHRKEARDALDRIRKGQAELVSISVPYRLIGHLERRNGDGPWIQTMSFSDAGALQHGGTWMLSAVQLRIIAEALGDLDSNFRLSFGVFGQYSAAARSRRFVTKQRLSPDTRRRLIWYCRASGQALTASRRAIDFATDEELVEVFGRASLSPHLIAHRNLLLQRVRVESGARGAR